MLADITPEQYDAISVIRHAHLLKSFMLSTDILLKFLLPYLWAIQMQRYGSWIIILTLYLFQKTAEVLLQKELQKTASDTVSDRSLLNIEDIWVSPRL